MEFLRGDQITLEERAKIMIEGMIKTGMLERFEDSETGKEMIRPLPLEEDQDVPF